jgi:isoleucyl-tRNA synthetase
MYVKAQKPLSDFYKEIAADELNVKNIVVTDDVRDFTDYTFKPQLKTLGRRFGKKLNDLKQLLSALDGNQAMDELNEKGSLSVTLDGVEEVLDKEDLLIEAAQKEGFVSSSDYGITVVLDTNLSEELIEEGFVYEIISKIQTMRKDAGFEVMDHIRVYSEGNEKIASIMEKKKEAIMTKVLAEEIGRGTKETAKEWNINGEKVTLSVEKIG